MAYRQLTVEERFRIAVMLDSGHSYRSVGRALGRPCSTITREVSRNSSPSRPYVAAAADSAAVARRVRPRRKRRLDKEPVARSRVLEALGWGWSPEQIAGRMGLDHAGAQADRPPPCARTVRRFAERLVGEGAMVTVQWPRPPAKRRARSATRGRIVGRVGIEHRPPEVLTRQEPGHWEGDTIVGRPGEAVLATLVERTSRFVVAFTLPTRHAGPMAQAIVRHMRAKVPERLRKTITFDNGKEFADFRRIERGLNTRVYFADPHSPWQRGANENANGLLRHYMPKKLDLTHLTPAETNAAAWLINNRPRKCLNWRTPAEVFSAQIAATKRN